MSEINQDCFYSFLGFKVPISGDNDVFLLSPVRGSFYMVVLFPHFEGTEESLSVLACAFSHVASIQHNTPSYILDNLPLALLLASECRV